MASNVVTFKHSASSGKRVKTSVMLSKGNYDFAKDNVVFLSISEAANLGISLMRLFGDRNARLVKMFIEKEMAEKQ